MTVETRLEMIYPAQRHPLAELREAVLEGLTAVPKRLPCRFFYDTAGSHLFEEICRQPEYYPTRTERAILNLYAGEMVEAAGAQRMGRHAPLPRTGPDLTLVELGSGSGKKTRMMISALLARQDNVRYVPIDISAEFLEHSAHLLLHDYPALSITGIAAEYSDGLAALPPAEARLILFMGSNIGNFEPSEAVCFLAQIAAVMQPADCLLLGADLVKERRVLEAAYNDAAGITARFNLNLLARINAELGGQFDLSAFEHQAPFYERKSRIEMRLVSRRKQSVPIAALDRAFDFEEGEFIHTENSHKYTPAALEALSAGAGLRIERTWMDEREWFTVALLRRSA